MRLAIMGLLATTLAAEAAPVSAPAAVTAPAAARPAQIAEWLAALSHPRFAVREQASEQLCHLPPAILPELVRRYRAEERYEPKRRIRYVIEYVFYREQIVGRDGFMGIEVMQGVLTDLTDPVSKATTRGVIIRGVKPGFAAERAGVRDHDVIIAFQGQPIPDDPSTTQFIQQVATHPPGSTVSLRVLRGGATRQVALPQEDAPAKVLEGAKLDAAFQDPLAPGVWVLSVSPDSPAWKLGLRANDVVRAVDGNRVSYGSGPLEELLRGNAAGRRVVLEMMRTEAVSLSVRLGSRPPEFITDPKDRAEVQARFLRWWQEQGGDVPGHPPEPPARLAFGAPGPPRPAGDSALIP